jgi:hypothetical protein
MNKLRYLFDSYGSGLAAVVRLLELRHIIKRFKEAVNEVFKAFNKVS